MSARIVLYQREALSKFTQHVDRTESFLVDLSSLSGTQFCKLTNIRLRSKELIRTSAQAQDRSRWALGRCSKTAENNKQ